MSSNNDDRDESQDAVVAGALRKAVATAFRDDRDAVTLRYIRTVVEKELGLGSEYFKLDPYWKDRSKEIVMQEVDIQSANHPEPSTQDEPPSSPPEKKKRGRKPAAKPAAKPRAKKAATPEPEDADVEEDEEEDVAPKARKTGAAKPSAEKKKPAAKRGKAKAKATVDDEDDDEDDVPKSKVEAPATVDDGSELSDIPDSFFDDVPPKKRSRKSDAEQVGSNKKLKSNPKASPKKASPKKASPKKASPKKTSSKAKKVDSFEGEGEMDEEPGVAMGGLSGDESEMSVVLDEPPPEKKKKSRSRSTTTTGDVTKKSKAAGKPKKEKAPGKDLSPDEEKIKSLQGWLLKCGVRKFWSRELAKYDSSKEKIKHLKGLLEEVGMTGQYSMAKAKKIKEDRELAAEVAWVQKGATDWGKETDEQVTTRAGKAAASTSGRKLTQKSRGFEGLDFLDDQSDDDSD